jgi:hypothetical protein
VAEADVYFEKRASCFALSGGTWTTSLPKYAETRGSTRWADLVSIRRGEVFAANYGCGMSVEEAKESARKRHIVEQGSH